MSAAELIARVGSATGRSREIDADVYEWLGYGVKRRPELLPDRSHSFTVAWKYLHNGRWYAMLDLTASLDAVLALCAEKLPGWHRGVTEYADGECRADIWNGDHAAEATCRTMPLALLAALLRALDTQEPDHGR